MATEPTTHDESTLRVPSVRRIFRSVLVALVSAPGRSTATLLIAGPYLWLGYYIVGTAAGRHSDVIIGGDWLTLIFTSYALVTSLALAHRILRIGLTELTTEYLLDSLALTWLTAFYFVWMLAREPVSTTTTVSELYEPVLAGDPSAVLWAITSAVVAVIASGIVLFPREDSRPFKNEFRTALVTFPLVVTALVLLAQPSGDSILWPVVIGVFLGTIVGGIARIHLISSALAKGLFAVLSFFVWTLGAAVWMIVYRRQPPTDHVVFAHVGFTGDRSDEGGDRGA